MVWHKKSESPSIHTEKTNFHIFVPIIGFLTLSQRREDCFLVQIDFAGELANLDNVVTTLQLAELKGF